MHSSIFRGRLGAAARVCGFAQYSEHIVKSIFAVLYYLFLSHTLGLYIIVSTCLSNI